MQRDLAKDRPILLAGRERVYEGMPLRWHAGGVMRSASGQKLTWRRLKATSAIPPKPGSSRTSRISEKCQQRT